MKVDCVHCGHAFDVAPGSVSAPCPACGQRVDLTSLETRGAPAAPALAEEDLIGVELGGYALTKVLGRGGMGVVYDAERRAGDGPERAAVKILSGAFSESPEFVARFLREAQALTRLDHENLAKVYAHGVHAREGKPPLYYFVMERFDGEDLRARMARGPIDAPTIASIVNGAARGLAYAHRAGIVHRDVKPANILVRGHGTSIEVKIVDFGVAHIAAGEYTLTSLTRSELILGTINYMAPEQRLDATRIDHRADVYALGAVAYELLTGRLPMGAFPRPSELVGALRTTVDRAVVSALRPDPDDRPESAIAFADSLSTALEPRSRLLFVLPSAAFVALVGVAGFYLGQPPTRSVVEPPTLDLTLTAPSGVAKEPDVIGPSQTQTVTEQVIAEEVPMRDPGELRPVRLASTAPKQAPSAKVFAGDIDEVLGALGTFQAKASGPAEVGVVRGEPSRPSRAIAMEGLADAIVGSAAATLGYARPAPVTRKLKKPNKAKAGEPNEAPTSQDLVKDDLGRDVSEKEAQSKKLRMKEAPASSSKPKPTSSKIAPSELELDPQLETK
ncbi:MAG: serine/threonine protein kinase [Deltaproteobacteria bacterium]|nr:serine/threonine protein kinase [Deltaproteobacteria bacterium]